MAYVGTPIDTQNQFQSLQGKRFSGNGSTTAFTLDVAPSSVFDIEVFVENVRQDPNSAYALSGTTMTFTSAPASGTNNIYVIHQAKAVGTIEVPASNSGDTTFNGTITMNGGVVLNEESASVDFRVESNGDANCLIVDGSGDKVGIGEDVPEGKLHVFTGDASVGPNAKADELVVESDGHAGISILSGASNDGNIYFGDSGDDDIGFITYAHGSDNLMQFGTNAAERMRIQSDGLVLIGKTGAALGTAGTEIYRYGAVRITRDANTALDLNREGSDGFILAINNDASFEGGITFSGGTVSYSAFCGSHWTRLADNSKPTILRGTVIESIATMCDWYQAVAEVAEVKDGEGNTITPAHKVKEMITLPNGKSAGDAVTFTSDGKEYTGTYVKETNERLPMCKISDTEDSKAIYGVFMAWDDEDNGLNGDVNDMNIASIGAYFVRIHKDETVAIGDYLQSKGDGTAKKQADDILRSSTIAKVTSTEKIVTYDDGSYCVPCTLHCG